MRPRAIVRAFWQRLRLGDRATAVVEFALVLPILVALLLGMGDVAPTTMVKFKSANATQSLADLITQSEMLQTSDMVNAYAGALDVLNPFSTSTMTMRATSIASDGNGHAFVYWSCGQGVLPPLAAKSNVTTLSNGNAVSTVLYLNQTTTGGYTYNGTNTSIVQVDTQYSYSSPTHFVFPGTQTMVSTAYMSPRNSAYVGFPWSGSATNLPTAPASTTSTGSVTLSNGVVCNYAQ